MLDTVRKWINRYFAEEEALVLLLLIAAGLLLIATLGNVLTPLIAAAVLAFMVQGMAGWLSRRGLPEPLVLGLAFALFIGVFLAFLLVLLPLVWNQLRSLVTDLPGMLESLRRSVMQLRDAYPQFISEAQIRDLLERSSRDMAGLGQAALSFSLAYLPGVFGLAVYVVIVPLLVFFFLKDRRQVLAWCANLLPEHRPRLVRIWREMDLQLANYVRGKGIEMLIVGAVSIVAFSLFGLSYALLLGFLVGLSVVIPYVGAVVVTVPVAVVAWFQWGWTPMFGYLMLAYLVIQILDGNVLVPLLFSEANNLHPIAIILAVLVFGSFWGVWGAFFAIPLATLVKAMMSSWPRSDIADGAPDAAQ